MSSSQSKTAGPTHKVRLTADGVNATKGQWHMDGVPLGSPVGPPFTLETVVPSDGKKHSFAIAPVNGMQMAANANSRVFLGDEAATVRALAPICGLSDGRGEVLARHTVGGCNGKDALSQGDHNFRTVTLECDANLPGGVFVEWFRDGTSIAIARSDGPPVIDDSCPIGPTARTVTYGLVNHGPISAPPVGNGGQQSVATPKYDDEVSLQIEPCTLEIVVKNHAFKSCGFDSKATHEFELAVAGDHPTCSVNCDRTDVEWVGSAVAPGTVELRIPGVQVHEKVGFSALASPGIYKPSSVFKFKSEICGAWPTATDATKSAPAKGCLSHTSTVGDLKTSNYQDFSDYVYAQKSGPLVKVSNPFIVNTVPKRVTAAPRHPLRVKPGNLDIAALRQRLDDRKFWEGLLDPALHPKPAGSYGQNLYFTNGVFTSYELAKKIAALVGEFYKSPCRLVYNELEMPAKVTDLMQVADSIDFGDLMPFANFQPKDLVPNGSAFKKLAGDVQELSRLLKAVKDLVQWTKSGAVKWINDESEAAETAWDYAWTLNGPGTPNHPGPLYDRPLGKTDNGAVEALAYVAILYLAWQDDSEVGIVGTSHGSLVTAKATMAFGYAFPMAIPWMQRKVRMAHAGCVVHRSRLPLLTELLNNYDAHADVTDPFATVFGGHDRKKLESYYDFKFKGGEAPALSRLRSLDDPSSRAKTSAEDMHKWFMRGWLPFMASPVAPLDAIVASHNPLVGWNKETRDELKAGLAKFKTYGPIVGLSHYHSIEKNYFLLKGSDRHFSNKNFFR